MIKTRLNMLNKLLNIYSQHGFDKKLNQLTINILNMLLGFFFSTALATIPGQTGDWGVIGAAIIVTFYEILSFIIYSYLLNSQNVLITHINNIKIGVIYGLFVDAFKLGS